MIDHIAEQSGVASALVAQAIQHPSAPERPVSDDGIPSDQPDAVSPYQTARDAVAFYLAKRTQATRPPAGLNDALTQLRGNLMARGDGSGESVVGVSALPPSALNTYLAGTELRRTLDYVYCVGHPVADAGADVETTADTDWIRQLPRDTRWPSSAVMKAICALHHANPEEAVLIGGNLGEEVGPALDAGMKAVYVRLGILEATASEGEGFAPSGATSTRRPDGIVTRPQDLPRLPMFRRGKDDTTSPSLRPGRPVDRER
jgi:hypothetical protein